MLSNIDRSMERLLSCKPTCALIKIGWIWDTEVVYLVRWKVSLRFCVCAVPVTVNESLFARLDLYPLRRHGPDFRRNASRSIHRMKVAISRDLQVEHPQHRQFISVLPRVHFLQWNHCRMRLDDLANVAAKFDGLTVTHTASGAFPLSLSPR